jgi:RNA polymerase-binding transcription factor DksA
MTSNKTVQNLAIALTVANAQLLARLQSPPAANGSRHLRRHIDGLLTILQEMEQAVDCLEGEVDESSKQDYQSTDEDQVLCNSCKKSIPQARLDAVPGTRYCVSCAENLQKRGVDPFESATERDGQRFWQTHERGLEGDRLQVPAHSFKARGKNGKKWWSKRKSKAGK